MKPVIVTIDVPQPREAVYDFLDVLSNHELFTDHMMRDWHFDGPARGIGSKARLTAVAAGRTETIEMEVIEAERPVKTVERNVGAGGKRVGIGTYTLADLPGGGTRVTFTYAWQQAPWSERLAAPIARGILRRGNERAMQRLVEQLQNVKAGDAERA
jgi:Polyketide cyclase / dehydrase and lipid transport